MSLPILDSETFHRTVAAESAWYRSFAANMAERGGEDVGGVLVVDEGTGAFGLRLAAAADDLVVNLCRDIHRLMPEQVGPFTQRLQAALPRGAAWIAMVPGLVRRDLRRVLREAGWFHDGDWHQVWAPVDQVMRLDTEALPADLAIREAVASDEEAFLEAYVEGEEFATAEVRRAVGRVEFSIRERPGWTVFTATVAGEPAGFGFFHHAAEANVGCLSGGWTVPRLQKRGAQSAVIRARAELARERGCDIVISQCGLAGTSFRNLQRAGLRSAYTIPVWRSPDLGAAAE